MTHEENRIAADDLRTHKKIADELQPDFDRLALYPELVDILEVFEYRLEYKLSAQDMLQRISDVLRRARAIK